MGVAAFWAALATVTVAMVIGGVIGRLASERTIRQAIEKGLVSDGQTVRELMQQRGPSWPHRLIVMGIIIVFGALGVAVFAWSLAAQEPESTRALLGIAGFTLLLGVGFLAAGIWLLRSQAR
jgi:uncharacterized protein YneF (UPF0154 family)